MNKTEKEVYQKTIELYNGRCAICGNNNIHLHHIRYGGLYECIDFKYGRQGSYLYLELLQAINKQVEELGWK